MVVCYSVIKVNGVGIFGLCYNFAVFYYVEDTSLQLPSFEVSNHYEQNFKYMLHSVLFII
jgi:hypothetical protein